MPSRDIVAIGASAGGVEALRALVGGLPADLPAALFVVLHMPPDGTSHLPRILDRAGPLPAAHPRDGEEIRPGRIYVAPPGRHLLIADGRVRFSLGPVENHHRPAVDVLFRSAALAHGPRVVGVVLSGMLDDGTAGLNTIRMRGGLGVVQDPTEAAFPGMPLSALERAGADHVVPSSELGPLLSQLVRRPAREEAPPMSEDLTTEVAAAALDPRLIETDARPGTPSLFGCPECGGVLLEIREGRVVRYRCRTGHAFSVGTLLEMQDRTLEAALWTALRALEEKAALLRQLREQAGPAGEEGAEERDIAAERVARERAEVVRQILARDDDPDQVQAMADEVTGE